MLKQTDNSFILWTKKILAVQKEEIMTIKARTIRKGSQRKITFSEEENFSQDSADGNGFCQKICDSMPHEEEKEKMIKEKKQS